MMADDRPEDKSEQSLEDANSPDSGLPDSGRARRAPPTIDLEPGEVSGQTRQAAGDPAPAPESASQQPPREEAAAASEPGTANPTPISPPVSAPISPWVIAPVSGAVAAALVIGVGWMLGWPAVQPAALARSQVSTAAVDSLTERVARLESRADKPVAPAADPAAVARIAALEKSQGALRDEITALRGQAQKLAEMTGVKSAPDGAAAAPDLSEITARLDAIERASRTQSADIPQENIRPVDDVPLRRVVVASLLDLSVRVGDPFPATLAAAKSLSPEAAALQPLEEFAATGVPTAASLSRELLTLVPKLSPPALETDSVGSGFVEKLQAGASKLVRIERTDAVGNDRGAVVSRVTAAALRNDFNEARRELKTLPAADRAAAQSWIDKADARDAALAVSRQFAADAMSALAKPSQ